MVAASSSAMRREYPTASALRIAASLRSMLSEDIGHQTSVQPELCVGPSVIRDPAPRPRERESQLVAASQPGRCGCSGAAWPNLLHPGGYDVKYLFDSSSYCDEDRDRYCEASSGAEKSCVYTEWLIYFLGGLSLQMVQITERARAGARSGEVG